VQGSRRDSLDLAHPGRVFIATAFIALVVDQIAKAMVRTAMVEQQSTNLIPYVIRLTYVRNEGAAFGLFPGRQPVFILTSLLVLFVIAAFWRRSRPVQWPVVVALALVTAGAVGNLIDRSILGYVTDFFEFGFVQFPVFNVADSCIVIGVAILMVWILFGPEDGGDSGDSE
jgi:signal peptidase II